MKGIKVISQKVPFLVILPLFCPFLAPRGTKRIFFQKSENVTRKPTRIRISVQNFSKFQWIDVEILVRTDERTRLNYKVPIPTKVGGPKSKRLDYPHGGCAPWCKISEKSNGWILSYAPDGLTDGRKRVNFQVPFFNFDGGPNIT